MKTSHQLIGLLFVFAFPLSAKAETTGKLNIAVVSYSPYPNSELGPSVSSSRLTIVRENDGTFSLTDKDGDAYIYPIKINVSPEPGAVAGAYTGSSLTFDLPYFALRNPQMGLAAALSNDNSREIGRRKFNSTATAKTSLPDIVLQYVRARKIWIERYAAFDSLPPDQSDLVVLFWYLESARDLVSKSQLAIDTDTLNAIQWMDNALSSPKYDKLFATSGVSRADSKTIVQALRARDGTVYSLTINMLSKDVSNPGRQLDACKRNDALVAYFDQVEASYSEPYSGWPLHQTIARKNQAICSQRALQASNAKPSEASERELEKAKQVLEAVTKSVQAQRPGDPLNVKRATNEARERAKDLSKAIRKTLPF